MCRRNQVQILDELGLSSFNFPLPKYQNCPQLTPEGVLKNIKNCLQLRPKKCQEIPFPCPRNTQALTTENVRLLKTVMFMTYWRLTLSMICCISTPSFMI